MLRYRKGTPQTIPGSLSTDLAGAVLFQDYHSNTQDHPTLSKLLRGLVDELISRACIWLAICATGKRGLRLRRAIYPGPSRSGYLKRALVVQGSSGTNWACSVRYI